MPIKKATQQSRRKAARKSSVKAVPRKLSEQPVKEGRVDYSSAPVSLEEINQNLLQLQSGLIAIQQRLMAFEAELSTLSEAQRQIALATSSTADDWGWLGAAEPAFAFWNNAEDEVYDTL